ncbi:MAG: DNA polymerase I [Acholeplasmatales bacterium]|jgi:DNA polymerase-1|nr:DNA polymerase I [Acholeplasmatales bacterium]
MALDKKILIIDGNSLMFRAYYATMHSTILKTSYGIPTNALYGFINLTRGILKDCQYCLIAFDTDSKTFRHLEFSSYKATRKPLEEDLASQIDLIYEYLDLMGIKRMSVQGYEGDDIIGSAAKILSTKANVEIYSSDRDLLQLIDDHVIVNLIKSGTKDIRRYDKKTFEDEYQIKLERFVDLKAIQGDASDNIPGIKGVGPKGATELLQKYTSLEDIYDHLDDLTPSLKEKFLLGKTAAFDSRRMAQIVLDMPLDLTLSECLIQSPNFQQLQDFFMRYELHNLIKGLKDTSFSTKEALKDKTSSSPQKPPAANPLIKTKEQLTEILSLVKDEISLSMEDDASKANEYNNYHLCQIKYIAFSFGTMSYYFDPQEVDPQSFYELLANPKIQKNLYNYKRLLVLGYRFNFSIKGPVIDTMLIAYLLNNSFGKEDLYYLAKYYGFQGFENLDLVGTLFEEVINPHIAALAVQYLTHKFQELEIPWDLYLTFELPLSQVLAKMEYRGILVDVDELHKINTLYEGKLKELEKTIYEQSNQVFNINSPKQLSKVLYDDLHLGSKLKHNYSTAHEQLLKLKPEHPIIITILEYRILAKLVSTYLGTLENKLDANHVVHTIYTQTITTTGRLSSIEPNLQNIPTRTEEGREIKKIFVARANYQLVGLDYSQIELRVLASMGNVQSLISAFNNQEDIHLNTAKAIFATQNPTSQMRSLAKTINFGILYGQGPYSLAEDLHLSIGEAREFIAKYMATYPEIKTYMDATLAKAKTDLYVETLFKRRRYIEELASTNKNLAAFGARAAINAPIQGTAADLIKLAMIKIDEYLTSQQLDAYLLLTIHDELILEVRTTILPQIKDELIKLMEGVYELKVKLKTSYDQGLTWFDLK